MTKFNVVSEKKMLPVKKSVKQGQLVTDIVKKILEIKHSYSVMGNGFLGFFGDYQAKEYNQKDLL